jgi:hypothetical protein
LGWVVQLLRLYLTYCSYITGRRWAGQFILREKSAM